MLGRELALVDARNLGQRVDPLWLRNTVAVALLILVDEESELVQDEVPLDQTLLIRHVLVDGAFNNDGILRSLCLHLLALFGVDDVVVTETAVPSLRQDLLEIVLELLIFVRVKGFSSLLHVRDDRFRRLKSLVVRAVSHLLALFFSIYDVDLLRTFLRALVGELRGHAHDPALVLLDHTRALLHVEEGCAGCLGRVFINAHLHEGLFEAISCKVHRVIRHDLVHVGPFNVEIIDVLAVQNLVDACGEILAHLRSLEIDILLQDWVILNGGEESFNKHLEFLFLLERLNNLRVTLLRLGLLFLNHGRLVHIQEVKEAHDGGLRDVVLDTCCSEVLDKGFKVSLGDQEGVDLLRLHLVLVEPLVSLLEQTGQEHGVLRDKLLVVLRLPEVLEHVVIVGSDLLEHAVHDVAKTHLAIQLLEKGLLFAGALIKHPLLNNWREADLWADVSNPLNEFSHDLELWLEFLERVGKDNAGLVEDFIGDAQVLVHFGHGLSNVELAAVKFEFEVGAELLFQHFHLFWVLELLVVACQLGVTHNVLHELLNKKVHFVVASKLLIKRSVLSHGGSLCRLGSHWAPTKRGSGLCRSISFEWTACEALNCGRDFS